MRKIRLVFLVSILIANHILGQSIDSTLYGKMQLINYFPLEVGNRWDYFRTVEIPGGYTYYDSVSFEIVGIQVLSNNKEYYEFSSSYQLLPYGYSKFVRAENNDIYFYFENDSTDCLIFKFNIPEGNFYKNCFNFPIYVGSTYIVNLWGQLDSLKHLDAFYIFSEHYGIYQYWFDALTYEEYNLKGCRISGQIYGNLIVSVEDCDVKNEIYDLSQNYPNPFNPSTKISWQAPVSGWQTLKVYDILGNEVATLVDEYKNAGSYEVDLPSVETLHATSLPSGVYFYRLRVGEFAETKKMILLK